MKAINILAVNNQLGEGIVWHPNQQSVWWTDILASTLFCYHLQQDTITRYPLPERLACFGFIEDNEYIIAAFASGIALYHLTSGAINWLARPEQANLGNRFNDGGVDRNGRFWAGTMVEQKELSSAPGQLYYLATDGQCHSMLANIEISNSLSWSLNGDTLYHTDSPSHAIYQYQLRDQTLVNKTLFATTPQSMVPDGACVDNRGHLWSAHWGGSRVVEYDQTGKLLSEIVLPVSQPTCVAIGGPNLDLLCVTTAKQGLSDSELAQQPQAGNLFIYQLDASIGINECYADTAYTLLVR